MNFCICRVYKSRRRGFGCDRRKNVRKKRLKLQKRKRKKRLGN